jgi:pimeloyl-ACP methyl ester carboxylesterase
MATLSVNGRQLHVQEQGVGDPILLIHGTATSTEIWAGSVAALADLGRVISYDRRGNGLSERPVPFESVSVASQADDAAALLEALDAVPAIVIGRGYGGAVTVDLALRFPDLVRALVLLEPALYALSIEAAMWHMELVEATEAVAASDPAAVGAHYLAGVQGDEADDEVPPSMATTIAENGPAVLAETRGTYALTTDALAAITMPTLLVVGAESPDAFRQIADAMMFTMSNSQPRLVPGGHFVDPSSPSVMGFLKMVLDGTWTGPPDLETGE